MKPIPWAVSQNADGTLIALNVQASWFGGSNDPQDDGSTSSGISTKDNPLLLGCALPVPLPNFLLTAGTPLPPLEWGMLASGSLKAGGTLVQIWNATRTILVPLIDVGPALDAGRAIDLTQAAFTALGGDLEAGLQTVSYRIFPNCLPKS